MAKKINSISETIVMDNGTSIGEIRGDLVEDVSMLNVSINLYDNSNLEDKKTCIKKSFDDFMKDFKDEVSKSNWKFITE